MWSVTRSGRRASCGSRGGAEVAAREFLQIFTFEKSATVFAKVSES